MYTFDEKFKKGAARAFRAQQGLTVFLSGLNIILPEPPGFKTEKPKDKREDTIRIADTAGDSWYLGFSERSITPPDIDTKNYYIGGNLSAPPRRVRGVLRARASCFASRSLAPINRLIEHCGAATKSPIIRIR
ncbi:unknown [Ruminococcus sp. CAG:177]|nr:unknown [Ruminococcus sp. CAG:177]